MAIPSEIGGLYKHLLVHVEALIQNLSWVHRGRVSLYVFHSQGPGMRFDPGESLETF